MEEKSLEEQLEECRQKMKQYYYKNLLFDLLIERYGDYIRTNEAKTIQDLKRMIQPEEEGIRNIANDIIRSIPDYNPEKDLEKTLNKAYEYVCENIQSVPSLGINFWMTVKEILKHKVSDYEDKAIFTCSLFRALGADASVLIVKMQGGTNRPLVLVRLKDSDLLCDPNHRHDFFKYKKPLPIAIKEFEEEGRIEKVLYEFNDEKYVDYE